MLKRADLHPARDHKPSVRIALHPIGRLRIAQGPLHPIAIHTNINIHGLCRLKQTVQMFIHEGPCAVIKTQPLPNPVPKHKPAVIYADQGTLFGQQLPIEVNQNVFIAGIFRSLVSCYMICHISSLG